MKAAPFDFYAPTDLEEALGLLREHGDDARPLAGGQSLVPLMALRMARFGALVDLNRLEALRGVERRNGTLVLGAMTRQATIERDAVVRDACPMLADATRHIGHFQIRNRGTIGGSIAHADPTAEYPAVALALGAEVEVASAGAARRRITAEDLLDSAWTTTLEPEELIVAIHVPVWGARSGFAVDEIARRTGDFALVGGVAGVTLGADGRIERAAVALFGVSDRARRLTALESALEGADPTTLDLRQLAGEATAELDPPSDVQASGAYRRRVAGPLTARIVSRAFEQAARNSE